MGIDVVTLSLAKNYADSKGSGGTTPTTASGISYTNSTLEGVTNVKEGLDLLTKASHSHTNKEVLDKLSESNGKLKYNGSDVGLKGDPGKDGTDGKTPVKGTDYWTDADKTEIVNDVLAALPTWTGGSY